MSDNFLYVIGIVLFLVSLVVYILSFFLLTLAPWALRVTEIIMILSLAIIVYGTIRRLKSKK